MKVLAETPPSVPYRTTFNNYDIELCVPEKSLEIYKATYPWSKFVNIIAHSFEVDGIYYNITDSEKLTVEVTFRGSNYNSYSNEYTGDVVIPETVTYESKTYSVTSIGYHAFYYCSGLTSVTIPDGVTSIGDYAFEFCSSLTSVTIPEGVTSISNYAFYGCSSLTSITIPEGVTRISFCAFNGCSSLTSITIPNSVTSIGELAFYRTAWYNNQPDGVVYAGKVAYKYKGTMPSNTSIELAEGTLGIANEAFYGCSNLTSVTIPDGVTSIGEFAFSDCSSLTSVTIPDDVTSIGRSAFRGCSSLASVTIGDGVTSIGEYAFYNCSSLTSVKVLAETPPFAYDNTFSSYDAELNVPLSAIELYKTTSPWSSFVNIIALAPPSTTSLTIGSTGSTTFSSIYNLDFSNVEGLKAYTATGYNSDNGELTLVRIKEAKAGTGLYVSGTPGTYTIPTISSTAYNSLNMFVGVNEETTISTTDGIYTNYIYTKPTGKEAGFYKVTSDRAIPAGKAYLQIPTAWLNEETTSEAKAVKLVFDDGESTGIDEVNRVESKEDVIYDLQGRRVKNPSKGIYIINGKKVVR